MVVIHSGARTLKELSRQRADACVESCVSLFTCEFDSLFGWFGWLRNLSACRISLHCRKNAQTSSFSCISCFIPCRKHEKRIDELRCGLMKRTNVGWFVVWLMGWLFDWVIVWLCDVFRLVWCAATYTWTFPSVEAWQTLSACGVLRKQYITKNIYQYMQRSAIAKSAISDR